MTQANSSLLTFPCDFVIKVFGVATEQLTPTVEAIIRHHQPDILSDAIRPRPSKDGKYLALSITVTVSNQQQLDNIYRELNENSSVLMTL